MKNAAFTSSQQIDQSDLRRRLMADEISWQGALAAITSLKSPPWKTKEWKAKRDALIAKCCMQCGTNAPPLVLQHTWHPKPIAQLLYDLRGQHQVEWHAWIQAHPDCIDISTIPPDTDACPKCLSTTLRFRKKAKNWKCIATMDGVILCGHEFDTSIRVVSKTKISDLIKDFRRKSREEFETASGIGKQAVILAIDHHIRYISLQDTVTLCKRCAFVADRTKMILCKECRENYHVESYDRCSKCAGTGIAPSHEVAAEH